jgi:hypothetical protein
VNTGNPWTYDRATGVARIWVRPVDPNFVRLVGPAANYFVNRHEPGTMVSNVAFGSPGAVGGAFDPSRQPYRSVVKFFGRLNP